jgi:uncharacterized integral membrane protein (TIGR00698 family)
MGGIAASLVLACIAWALGRLLPIVGAPIIAIVLGAVLANVGAHSEWARPGASFTSKRVLQLSIILLGASLELSNVIATGRASFTVMIATLAAAFFAAAVVGRLLRVPGRLTLLIAAGTGICGGSAIAAIAPIVEAEDLEITYAMSTIFAFNLVAVGVFPLVGHLLHFSDTFFGTWAGTAINDTSSVVAAGYAYSSAAGNYATIVKLTRTTMIIPVSLTIAFFSALRRATPVPAMPHASTITTHTPNAGRRSLLSRFPWFILGFRAMSAVETTGVLPQTFMQGVAGVGRFLIVVALAAVGLNADLRKIAGAGIRPLLLGLSVWAVVALSSIALQSLIR